MCESSQSGFTSVINSVPEPGMTWRESNPVPERSRLVHRGGKSGAVSPPTIPPFAERDPVELATTTPNGVERGFDKLPQADLAKMAPAIAIKPNDGPFRAVTESDIRSFAAARAPSARRIEMENLIPVSHSEPSSRWHRSSEACTPQLEQFMRQARELMAQGDRIKSVSEAAGTFYQLADAEGEAEILWAGIKAFDEMLAEQNKPEKILFNGRLIDKPTIDPSIIKIQRGQLLEMASKLGFLVGKLNIDLKQQTGIIGHTPDRLYPTGEFGIDLTPLDVPSLVRTGIADRPDLQLLRLAYYELSEESLPAIRDQLQKTIGMLAPARIPAAIAGRHHPLVTVAMERFGKCKNLDPLLVHELAVRKAQLFDLICEKERDAADQVRLAALAVESTASLVGQIRARAELLHKQYDDLKAKKLGQPAQEFQLLFEWYKARAEVIQAVMNWHQARVKLMAAQGKV